MIQDIGKNRYHNEYRPVPPKAGDYILAYRGRQALVKVTGDAFSFPSFALAEKYCPGVYDSYTYLFSIDQTNYYLAPALVPEALEGFSFEELGIFRTLGPQENCFALITGFQLFSWYQTRKFCGKCGSPMLQDEKERMMRCPACQTMEYPKICPAVIVAVRHKDRLLLTKYAGPSVKRYALIAGFAEIGETLEQTVQREVQEEVGLRVKNIAYYKSQPWSLSSSLLAGFVCDLDGSDSITLDETELSTARWFRREEIPYDDYDVSLTREMMIQFKKGLL